MKRQLFFLLCTIAFGFLNHARSQTTVLRFETSKGDIDVMLYDDTPQHRDMFLKEIKKGTYSQAEFNRVIRNFVCQGGELDETILERERQHPQKGALRFPAELKSNHFHKKGVLGAGRDDNPEKANYYSQIYLVQGRRYTENELDSLEKKRHISIPRERRSVYLREGGIPYLDGHYTVFGEIIKGLDILEAINKTPTDLHDKPIKPERFSIRIMRE